MTINRLYRDFADQLKNIYDAREAANIADWVFESVAGIKRSDRIVNKETPLPGATTTQLMQKLDELLQHKPVQYVLEEAWFYKMKFFVNNTVLIPRPETEELVEWIAAETKGQGRGFTILDAGTGSGCIAIALKKELPTSVIKAIDVSPEALKVARQNAISLEAGIECHQIDFLDESKWHLLHGLDILVSNPPYIPAGEKKLMPENVVGYEPHIALFTPDADPFIFYRKIASFAQQHLNKNGRIYVEVHQGYAGRVSEIFTQYRFTPVIRKDMYGKDRMIRACR